jgi:hypothetical protein
MRREHIVAGDDGAGGEQAVFGQPTAEFVRSADQLCRDIPVYVECVGEVHEKR